MSTLRKLISDVRSIHKLLSTDNSITDRAIASEINNNTLMLIKRESNLRKLWSTDTIFTTIPCLELEEVSISECVDYNDTCTIAKSKVKIPKVAEGNYQYLIQGVYSINALGGRGTKLKEISVNRYINLLKLSHRKTENYYWITNDYLYVTNPDTILVRLTAVFENILNSSILNYNSKCNRDLVNTKEFCKNPLDIEYTIPSYLVKQVLDMTSQKLLNSYYRLKTDLTQEGIDSQSPNSKPTN